MNQVKMEDRQFPFEFVYSTLKKFSHLFTPPLSEVLDIEAYARKLSKKANFVVCVSEGVQLGFVAYYLNAMAHQIYISLICVDESYQAQGIGGKMLNHITTYAETTGCSYESIALEVNKRNGKAQRFYLKQGFIEQEDRGEKLLMRKCIK